MTCRDIGRGIVRNFEKMFLDYYLGVFARSCSTKMCKVCSRTIASKSKKQAAKAGLRYDEVTGDV